MNSDHSVRPRLRRNRLDVLRQRVHVHGPVFDARLAGLVHPAQRVLLPVHVVAIREVLARMRAAALLAVLGADDRGRGLPQQVVELDGLDEIGVPDEAAIGDASHRRTRRESSRAPSTPSFKRLAGAEHRGVALHGLLHLEAGSRPCRARPWHCASDRGATRRNRRRPSRAAHATGRASRWWRACRRGFAAEHHEIEQ